MKKFLNGISLALCVMSFCVLAGCSYAGDGGSGNQNPPVIDYGNTSDSQGTKVIAGWMDNDGNIKIGGTAIAQTSEVVAVPKGSVAQIVKTDNSSWNGYIKELYQNEFLLTDNTYIGVFVKDRKVKLDSFVMGQFEVTEQLYAQVMRQTVTTSIKPKVNVTWEESCAFCNELTKMTMSKDECVYYNINGGVYTIDDANKSAWKDSQPIIDGKSYDTTTHKWTKKGYRLPTEAEWEFCARGGDPSAAAWNYAYSGVNISGMVKDSTKANETNYDSAGWLYKDDNLNNYMVYKYSGGSIADVGTKYSNTLGLYDMCGNVDEWCYDGYWVLERILDEDEKDIEGNVVNPVKQSEGLLVPRGGCFRDDAYWCIVSRRAESATGKFPARGFRLVRSTN